MGDTGRWLFKNKKKSPAIKPEIVYIKRILSPFV